MGVRTEERKAREWATGSGALTTHAELNGVGPSRTTAPAAPWIRGVMDRERWWGKGSAQAVNSDRPITF